MPTEYAPTERQLLCSRLLLAFARLGWATPSSYEYASIASLTISVLGAEAEVARRGGVK